MTEALDSAQRVVSDMDSTEIPVYGQQEQSVHNGHFESTCYHPLLWFHREGDCLAARLRSGNVHSADGWEDMLLPEGPEGTPRQQKRGKEVVFRADAAFAKPEMNEIRLWLSLIAYNFGNLWRRLFAAMMRRMEALPAPTG